MHPCLLSTAYGGPTPHPHRHHGPLDLQHWRQQTAHPHDITHVVCHLPWTENTSQTSQTPWNVSIFPLKSFRMTDCSQVETEHADELSWDGFRQFVQKFFGYANRLLQQLPGWQVWDYHGGEDAGCGGAGLVWLHVVYRCEAGWTYCQILWNADRESLWWRNEHLIHGQQPWLVSLQPACQLNLTTPVCCAIKRNIPEYSFIVFSLRHTCAIFMPA